MHLCRGKSSVSQGHQEWAKQALPGLLQGPSIDRYCGDELLFMFCCASTSHDTCGEFGEHDRNLRVARAFLIILPWRVYPYVKSFPLCISYKCKFCCEGYGFQAV